MNKHGKFVVMNSNGFAARFGEYYTMDGTYVITLRFYENAEKLLTFEGDECIVPVDLELQFALEDRKDLSEIHARLWAARNLPEGECGYNGCTFCDHE